MYVFLCTSTKKRRGGTWRCDEDDDSDDDMMVQGTSISICLSGWLKCFFFSSGKVNWTELNSAFFLLSTAARKKITCMFVCITAQDGSTRKKSVAITPVENCVYIHQREKRERERAFTFLFAIYCTYYLHSRFFSFFSPKKKSKIACLHHAAWFMVSLLGIFLKHFFNIISVQEVVSLSLFASNQMKCKVHREDRTGTG